MDLLVTNMYYHVSISIGYAGLLQILQSHFNVVFFWFFFTIPFLRWSYQGGLCSIDRAFSKVAQKYTQKVYIRMQPYSDVAGGFIFMGILKRDAIHLMFFILFSKHCKRL